MKSFYAIAREYYMRLGYDYREASHHATADVEWIRNILIGGATPKDSNQKGN